MILRFLKIFHKIRTQPEWHFKIILLECQGNNKDKIQETYLTINLNKTCPKSNSIPIVKDLTISHN